MSPSYSARAHLAELREHVVRATGATYDLDSPEAVAQLASAYVLLDAIVADLTDIEAHHLAALEALRARVDAVEAVEARNEADAEVERRRVGEEFFRSEDDGVQANDPTEGDHA